MKSNFENNSAMQKSADLFGSADSLGENHCSPSLEQLNYKAKQLKEQSKYREKIDTKEHEKADLDLQNEIKKIDSEYISNKNLKDFIDENFEGNSEALKYAKSHLERQTMFGAKVSKTKLKEKLNLNFSQDKEISTADKIEKTKIELDKQGKSQTEILQILISKYENEEAISTWVGNWKNFLKLHQFAENMPPAERLAIQKIISNADFTDENAFNNSLISISNSSEISAETKIEISREFNGANVSSVDEMDAGLKLFKTRKKQLKNVIKNNTDNLNSINTEITNLETELDSLPLESPKRKEIEQKITRKKEVLKKTETTIESLTKESKKDVSFVLRDGIVAKLNSDGSRSIKISRENFSIKLPSHFLPFSTNRNLRSVNIAFPFLALKSLNIANVIFSPNIENNSVPSKAQQKMAHLIFESLGIDDKRILSEEKINQLKTDLSRLTNSQDGKTGKECLIEMGIYDINSQSLNQNKLKNALKFIRENKNIPKEVFFEGMKENLG